jgi:hypothetical protein
MTPSKALGYSFLIALPPAVDARLRRWTEATPGASWDVSGGHVTLARFTGTLAPSRLVPAFHEACAGMGAFDVCFSLPVREAYWDKPGLEIVMLSGDRPADVAGAVELRERLIASLAALTVGLMESGPFQPHITLTTGLPHDEALALEAAAAGLQLRFTAHEIVLWSGRETAEEDAPADPPWHAVERVLLL